MAMTKVITARLDERTFALVDSISAAQGRSRAWFAAEAIRRVAEAESDFAAFVQAGIDSADAGRLTPQDQVFAELRGRRRQRAAE